jgi:uncharacterized membrane protein YphA (DoxX/SURF4 family)
MTGIRDRLPTVARILLGLVFFVFGLNGFFNFLPNDGLPDGAAGAFIGALAATGYMFPLIKGTELVASVLLLANKSVPLALVLLAPVVVNIAAFHAFLAPAGSAMVAVIALLGGYLAWVHRAAYAPLFQSGPARLEPVAPSGITAAPSET